MGIHGTELFPTRVAGPVCMCWGVGRELGVYWPKAMREPEIQNWSYKEIDPKVALKVWCRGPLKAFVLKIDLPSVTL